MFFRQYQIISNISNNPGNIRLSRERMAAIKNVMKHQITPKDSSSITIINTGETKRVMIL